MIRGILAVLVFPGLCLLFPSQAGVEEEREEVILIVADFKAGGFGQKDGELNEALEIAVAAELSRREGIAVVKRERLERVLREMELGLAGFTDEKKSQLKVGRIVGADYIVTGSLIKTRTKMIVNSKLVDIESGKVYSSRSIEPERAGALDFADEMAKAIVKLVRQRAGQEGAVTQIPAGAVSPARPRERVEKVSQVNWYIMGL